MLLFPYKTSPVLYHRQSNAQYLSWLEAPVEAGLGPLPPWFAGAWNGRKDGAWEKGTLAQVRTITQRCFCR